MRIKNKIIILCLCLASLVSCQDDLDYNEFVTYDKEQIFSSFGRTKDYVNNIYSYLDYDYGNFGGGMLASASDEAEYAWTSSNVHDFYNGTWSPTNAKADVWNNHYAGIRAANFFLEECAGRTFDDFKNNKEYEDEMTRFNRYQYEVRFLRAYLYFNLVKHFKDVPLVLQVVSEEEANAVARESHAAVLDFVIAECDAIFKELPIIRKSPFKDPFNETGRISGMAVKALKARVLLYYASPLYNSNNDAALWQRAALANKEVIDLSLENGIALGKYTDIWGTDSYKTAEGIFMRRIGDLNDLEGRNFPIGVEGGRSGNCPTQTLVDAYGMKSTGLAWDAAGSGYDANNPYANRDPRMAMTIAKNGDIGWPAYNTNALETFVGGRNAAPLSGATPTGYYLKKHLDGTVDLRPASSNSKRHSWVTYRLGEFYLNYAEATYQYLGGADATNGDLTMSAREAVNIIRNRTGVEMPNLVAGMSNTDFEKAYINERMVELAFEGHSFWDVRRWKRGELLKEITRMKITKDNSGAITYEREKKLRLWDDKMYFFPIPDGERRKNTNLTQNTGW